jgi:hypothetical protein
MNNSSIGDGMTGSRDPDANFRLRRNANEELARILGGIGALPEPQVPSDRVEALRTFSMVEWLP